MRRYVSLVLLRKRKTETIFTDTLHHLPSHGRCKVPNFRYFTLPQVRNRKILFYNGMRPFSFRLLLEFCWAKRGDIVFLLRYNILHLVRAFPRSATCTWLQTNERRCVHHDQSDWSYSKFRQYSKLMGQSQMREIVMDF